MKAKIGDRVSFFISTNGGPKRLTGVFKVTENGFAVVEPDGASCRGRYRVIPATLRKLVKKERLRFWMRRESIKQWLEAGRSAHMPEPVPNNIWSDGGVEFVEVKRK